MKPAQIKAVKEFFDLDDTLKSLISMANLDLHYGPGTNTEEDAYPGFESACKTITASLPVLSGLWYDKSADMVESSEPELECECTSCDGCGLYGSGDDQCQDCDGTGLITINQPDDFMELTAKEVKAALVGKDLAPHV